MRAQVDRLQVLRMVYASPAYTLVNISAAIFYYFLFRYVLASQNYGIFLLTAPQAWIYALVISSSVLLTLGVYGIRSAFEPRGNAITGEGASVATTLLGALVSGCASCQAPLIGTLLYAAGLDALSVSGVISWIGSNQALILLAFIVINLAMIYYSTGKIAEGCRIRQRRRRG
ncbi:MAG: hypothetical protein KGH58_02050 [Candidatus Micrarchaeota archaeon]|nr:hypothetical protein [Candidatus Micrarchaeota archaeon]